MLAKNIPNALQSVDPNHLVAVMRQDGGHESALDVEYIQFAKLYEFTTNLEKRFSHSFRLILITIEQSKEQTASETDTERAMYYLERAIQLLPLIANSQGTCPVISSFSISAKSFTTNEPATYIVLV